MEKICQYISKKVVSIDDGVGVGYILNASFDEQLRSLLGFVVVDEESEKENFLPFEEIVATGEEYVFVQETGALNFAFAEQSSPIGKIIFDDKGQCFGKVKDVIVEKKFVKKIITEKCEILPSQIYSNGRDYIFISNKKKNSKKSKKIEKNAKNLPKIQILSENIPKNQIFAQKTISRPTRLTLTPTSIVGKVANCDIFGYNNELIVRKNEVISESKVLKAKKHGKLNLLIFNCRENNQ